PRVRPAPLCSRCAIREALRGTCRECRQPPGRRRGSGVWTPSSREAFHYIRAKREQKGAWHFRGKVPGTFSAEKAPQTADCQRVRNKNEGIGAGRAPAPS